MAEIKLTAEQNDFISEMMNIGAGNAAAALARLLKQDVSVDIPEVKIVSWEVAMTAILASAPVITAVSMKLFGDIDGNIFLIFAPEKLNEVSVSAKSITRAPSAEVSDLSVEVEIGHVLAGTYLKAIYDFCKLEIFHSVGTTIADFQQSEVSLGVPKGDRHDFFLVKNSFTVNGVVVSEYFIRIPYSHDSVDTLVNSIGDATRTMMNPSGYAA